MTVVPCLPVAGVLLVRVGAGLLQGKGRFQHALFPVGIGHNNVVARVAGDLSLEIERANQLFGGYVRTGRGRDLRCAVRPVELRPCAGEEVCAGNALDDRPAAVPGGDVDAGNSRGRAGRHGHLTVRIVPLPDEQFRRLVHEPDGKGAGGDGARIGVLEHRRVGGHAEARRGIIEIEGIARFEGAGTGIGHDPGTDIHLRIDIDTHQVLAAGSGRAQVYRVPAPVEYDEDILAVKRLVADLGQDVRGLRLEVEIPEKEGEGDERKDYDKENDQNDGHDIREGTFRLHLPDRESVFLTYI